MVMIICACLDSQMLPKLITMVLVNCECIILVHECLKKNFLYLWSCIKQTIALSTKGTASRTRRKSNFSDILLKHMTCIELTRVSIWDVNELRLMTISRKCPLAICETNVL